MNESTKKQVHMMVDSIKNMLVIARNVRQQLEDNTGSFSKHASVGLVSLANYVEDLQNSIQQLREFNKIAKRVEVGEYEVCPHMAPALHYGDFEMEHMDLSDASKLAIRKFEHKLREEHGSVDFDVEDDTHMGKCVITGEPGMVVTVKVFADK